MNLEQINVFLADYNIGNARLFKQLPKTTSGNDSFVVTTDDNMQYVLRKLVRQTDTGAENERQIQTALRSVNIVCPLYLTTNSGGVATTKNNTSVVVSRLVEGSRQPQDTIELAGNMGSTLALIHNSLQNIHISPNEQQWFNLTNAKHQLNSYAGPEKDYIRRKTNEYSSILNKDLPQALTHGDFHTNNIFSANNAVTAVFDFESAEYTVRILDIARLYLTYRKVTMLEPSRILDVIISNYSDSCILPLTRQEIAELYNACIYAALVSSVSIYNQGNTYSSQKYLEIAKSLMQ